MEIIESHYFETTHQWRTWLLENHDQSEGIHLIFYKVSHDMESMRWEEAVRVALCFGWIDSTVKSLGNGKRRQYFCPRKAKSVWSRLNKQHIEELIENGAMHQSGLDAIARAKKNGSWSALDDVENGVVPEDLQRAFALNTLASKNYRSFTPGQRKSYLYWLHQAKRQATREKRISEIIALCEQNVKYRTTR